MGYMTGYGECFGCHKLFTFNPTSVPSYHDAPICRDCIERANAKRKTMGLPLWPVASDAYEPEEVA